MSTDLTKYLIVLNLNIFYAFNFELMTKKINKEVYVIDILTSLCIENLGVLFRPLKEDSSEICKLMRLLITLLKHLVNVPFFA